MAVLTRYKDFSSAKEIFKIPAGTTLKEFLPGTDWKNYAVFVNGEKADENVSLKEKDIVMIRSVPHGVTTAVLIGLAVAGAVAVGSAVYAGYQMYQAKKESQRMQEELEKLQSSTSDGVTNIPTVKGASNTTATSKTQPYIIGRHLFTPYILNAGGGTYKGYHKIAGVNGIDEYYNVVLELGFNKQVLESVMCDDVKVADIGSDSPQEGIFPFNSNSAFSGGDSFMEVAQDGEKFDTDAFNTKVVETEPSAEVGKTDDDGYTPLYYTLESNAKACDVVIQFNGLYTVNGEGNTVERTRNIDASWSEDYAELSASGDGNPDGNATWHSFPFSQAIWHGASESTQKSSYYWKSAEYRDGDYTYGARSAADRAKKNFKNYMSAWTLKSGVDLRNSSGVTYSQRLKVQSRRMTRNSGKYKYWVEGYIYLTKTTYTPGYYEDRNSSAFTYAKKTQMRFNAHADIPFSYRFDTSTDDDGDTVYTKKSYPVTVRIKTTDAAYSGSGSAVDSCYVKYVQSTCFNEKKSAEAGYYVDERIIGDREAKVSTLLGIRIKATSSNEDKLGKISVITNGLARTWDSGAKSWSTGKSATSNVAAWVLEILTSDTHAPSKAEDEEIDLESFGEWYEYCDKYGLYVNKVLTQGATKESVLSDILPLGRGALYMSIYGKIAAAFDSPDTEPVALFNGQNLRSFTYEKELARQPDGVKVTFTDADAGFEENSIIEMYDGSDADDRGNDCAITEINGAGITSQYEAWQYAHYTMNVARLRPRTAKAKIGKEGIYLAPYSKVLVQHSSLKIGLGSAEIKSVVTNSAGDIIGFVLYDALDLDKGNDFYVSIQCVSGSNVSVITKKLLASGERTKEISLESSIPASTAAKPKQGDVLSYGTGESTITEPFLITGAEPDADGYTLTLVDYSPKIFDFGDVPVFESPLSDSYTPVESREIPSVENVTQSNFDVIVAASEAAKKIAEDAAQEAADTVQHGIHFKSAHRISDFSSSIDDLQRRIDETAKNAANGISVTEDEILLYVNDKDKQQSAALSLKADQIMQTVNDNQEETSSAISQQSDAIQAMVEGGGSSAYAKMSLEIPAVIDNAMYAKILSACKSSLGETSGAALVGNVYAETRYATADSKTVYTIRNEATDAQVEQMWEILVAAGLIASEIDLSATQVKIAAENVVITDKTNSGQTIVSGGKINTELIEAGTVVANAGTIKNTLQSANYAQDDDGTPTKGFICDAENDVIKSVGMVANNMTAEGGTFNLIKASDIFITGNSSFSGTIESGPLVLKNKEVSGQSYSWSANTNAAEIFDSVPSSNKSKSMSLQTDKKTYEKGILIYNLTGLINGISYTKMFYSVSNFIIFLNENLEELLHFDASKEKNSTGNYSYITRIPYATEYIFTNPNSKTLKLIDLPTSEPSETGVVWNDNGILKIKI